VRDIRFDHDIRSALHFVAVFGSAGRPKWLRGVLMGVDLNSIAGDSLHTSHMMWSFVLNLAERYGWHPAGTEPPAELEPGEKWLGDYDTNDGQKVTTDDALALAKALESAANDPQLHLAVAAVADAHQDLLKSQFGSGAASFWRDRIVDLDNLYETIRDFSYFCEDGEFLIE
jgi:hypothetical protein